MADSAPLDDVAVRRYLLGRASADESSEVEDRYFDNPDLFDRIEEQDEALTQDYLAGRLTPAERTDFEQTLATMPRRQERLALIRQLQRRRAKQGESGWRRVGQALAMFIGDIGVSPRWAYALGAACAVLIVATTWLGSEVVRLRSEVQDATVAREAAQRESSAARGALEAERTARSASQTAGAQPSPAPSPGRDNILAVMLTPGLLRDGPVTRVSLAQNVVLVRFGLVLPETDATRYQVALRASSGEERWRQSGVRAREDGRRTQLLVEIPSAVLESGQLTLVVTPLGQPLSASEQYHFAVVR